MKFIIKWRNRNTLWVTSVKEGMRKYASLIEAQNQVNRWKLVFPFNTYYIEEA